MPRRIADVPDSNYHCRSSPRIGAVGIERTTYFEAVLVQFPFTVVHKGEYALVLDVSGIGKEIIDNVFDVLDNTVLLSEALWQSTFFSIVSKYHSKAFFH